MAKNQLATNQPAPTPMPSLTTLQGFGQMFAASGLFADTREAAQAAVKMQAGAEMGFGPFASMTGVSIIQGKACVGAHLMAAAVMRTGRYTYRVLEHTNEGCRIEFRLGDETIGVSAFTREDAAAAGLLSKDNWRRWPRNMYFARAMSNGVRWYCPDALGGPLAYTPDEMGVETDEDGNVIDAAPVPTGERKQVTNTAPEPSVPQRRAKLIGDGEAEVRIVSVDKVSESKPDDARKWRLFRVVMQRTADGPEAEVVTFDTTLADNAMLAKTNATPAVCAWKVDERGATLTRCEPVGIAAAVKEADSKTARRRRIKDVPDLLTTEDIDEVMGSAS